MGNQLNAAKINFIVYNYYERKYFIERMYKVFHRPGEIILKGRSYQDQLSEEIVWVSSIKIEKYLEDKYKLTLQEYYNIIVFGDINHITYCWYCKKIPTKFRGLRLGYNDYCNQSCITTERLYHESNLGINPFQNKEFIEQNRSRASEYQKLRIQEGTHQFLDRDTQLLAEHNRFILENKDYDCYIYIATVTKKTNLYKIGASRGPVMFRSQYRGTYLIRHHVIYSGTAKQCADVELEIKRLFCDHEFIDGTKLHQLFQYLKQI